MLSDAASSTINMRKFKNVQADLTFNTSRSVDIFYAIIALNGFKEGQLAAQNKTIGGIIFGGVANVTRKANMVSSFLPTADIDKKLQQSWEIDSDTSQ